MIEIRPSCSYAVSVANPVAAVSDWDIDAVPLARLVRVTAPPAGQPAHPGAYVYYLFFLNTF
jgi:hypothetical protein